MNHQILWVHLALAVISMRGASAESRNADAAVELARQAAKADRHAESIDAYRQAIEAAPDRRGEWLLELADQLTWSKRLEEAIILYREAARTADPKLERSARRGLGRALSWKGDYSAAIKEYDRVLVLAPEDQDVRLARAEVVSWAKQKVDETIEHARQAAKGNRHAESIEIYRRAIKAAPERRQEWLLEMADQLTWSKQLKESIALYREASADPKFERYARRGLARALSWAGDHSGALAEYDRILALAPEDREARLARAEVLIWTNQQNAALAEYQIVLQDHPNDREAIRGEGRIQSWRGQHRYSAARVQQLLRDHPYDREATGILAESYEWMGRPDRAERLLREHLAVDPEDKWAASLLEELEFYQRAVAKFDWRESHQSDEVRTTMFSLDFRQPLVNGSSFVGLRYDLTNYIPPSGQVEEIVVQRPGLQAHHRISDLVDWHGGIFLEAIDTRGASGDHEILTFDTYFTLFPNDFLRFDIGSSRWTFDSQEALRKGLSAVQGSVSMDIMPDDLTRFSGRFNLADYSDGNERTWWQFEAEHRIWNEPRIGIGYRYTGFDFSESWQSGYYSPDLYHSNELLVRASGYFSDEFRWQLRSTIGYEHEVPGDSRMIWSAGGSVAWEIMRQLEIELGYDYSSSSAASSNGFDRGTGRLSLRYTF